MHARRFLDVFADRVILDRQDMCSQIQAAGNSAFQLSPFEWVKMICQASTPKIEKHSAQKAPCWAGEDASTRSQPEGFNQQASCSALEHEISDLILNHDVARGSAINAVTHNEGMF